MIRETEPKPAFPPCVQTLLRVGTSPEARYFLATFLAKAGMDSERIAQHVFQAPLDALEEITQHQLIRLTEQRMEASCELLQDPRYGLCPMMERSKDDWDPLCRDVDAPGTYYERKAQD